MNALRRIFYSHSVTFLLFAYGCCLVGVIISTQTEGMTSGFLSHHYGSVEMALSYEFKESQH